MGVGNLWRCIVRDDGVTAELPGIDSIIRLADVASPGPAILGVRAERIRIGTMPDSNHLTGLQETTTYTSPC
jgi:hypothetical protein